MVPESKTLEGKAFIGYEEAKDKLCLDGIEWEGVDGRPELNLFSMRFSPEPISQSDFAMNKVFLALGDEGNKFVLKLYKEWHMGVEFIDNIRGAIRVLLQPPFVSPRMLPVRTYNPRIQRALLMDFFPGKNLIEHLEELKKPPRDDPEGAGRGLLTYAQMLDSLHSQGFIFRDNKPDNILIGESGETAVCDYDTVGHEFWDSGEYLIYTPAYASRENVLGHNIRTLDLEGFALVIDHAFNGSPWRVYMSCQEIVQLIKENNNQYPADRRANLPPNIAEVAVPLLNYPKKMGTTAADFVNAIKADFRL